MQLVQILLPVTDNDGRALPEAVLRRIRGTGGAVWRLTSVPLRRGFDGRRQKDEIVIVEVMTEALAKDWWRAFGKRLERELGRRADRPAIPFDAL